MFSVAKFVPAATRRFGRDTSGHTVVEFALVALPFFLLMFGLAEIGLIGFAQSSLDHAVADTARRIRTGEAQGAGDSYTQVQTTLCNEMSQLMAITCDDNLFLDVDTFASFVAVQNTSPIQNGNLQTNQFGYTPGAASSIVVVRAYYRWHVLTPVFQGVFANLSGGDRLLVSTMMFRNEPF